MRRRSTLVPALAVAGSVALALPLLPAGAWAQEASAGPAASPVPEATAAATGTPTPTATASGAPAASPTATGTAVPSATPTATTAAPSPTASAAQVTTLRLLTSTALVPAGGAVTLTATALDGAGAPVAGEAVDVLSRQGGTTTVITIGRVVTGSAGTAVLTWRPRVTAEYSLRRVTGSAAATERRIVHVQPRLTATASPGTIGLGGTSVLRGTLAPAYAGARLQVQRRAADGTWRAVGVVATSGTGAWSWAVRPGLPGRYVFRAALPARMAHLGAASPAVAVQVTPLPAAGLRQGSSGAAVSALERALLAQKVDIGRHDGVFDGDLRHGVTAFQKSQGLPRTGVYDAATRTRLASPQAVRLRYPAAGRAVEVDLVKQVLYLSHAGRLSRIVDISSGNNELYTADGITSRAVTPTGRFRIERKIDGIRISRLGELYRPAYFYRGWAIHGSPSVPTYPASHGCIRVTNSAQDRLFDLLTIGTPVSIYG